MAVTYVNASTPDTDAGGAFTVTGMAPAQAGNIIILQILQKGTTNGAVTQTSATNITALAGTANTWTAITEQTVGASDEARQNLWIGRSTGTSAPTFTGGNSTSEDVYFRMYEFTGCDANATTLAGILENGTAGTVTNGSGTSSAGNLNVADTSVQTLGAGRLALNFIGVNDEVPAGELSAMAGETGGDWTYPVASWGSASGLDGGVGLVTAAMASAGTIDGGTDAISSGYAWGVIGFALIPELSPTVALGTPTDDATGVSTTPALVFTGTDGNADEVEYEIQVDTSATFDSMNNQIADSYSETNTDHDSPLGTSGVGGISAMSHTFTVSRNIILTGAKFYIKEINSPAGTLTANLRTSNTGSDLDTSDTITNATTTASYQLITFTFTGGYLMVPGTTYYIVLTVSSSDATNYYATGADNSSPSDDGNSWRLEGMGGWVSQTFDSAFYIYGKHPLLDILSSTDDDANWTGTGTPNPFPSGNAITYTLPT